MPSEVSNRFLLDSHFCGKPVPDHPSSVPGLRNILNPIPPLAG